MSSGSPSTTRSTLCAGYIDSSTWYSSYTIHVGISIPTVAMHRLRLSYGIYMESTLIPTKPTYHGLSPPVRPTYLPITDSFFKMFHKHSPHIFILTSHQAMTSNVIACQSISLFHPMMALTSRYPRATSPSSPHHCFKSSLRGPSRFLTKFYSKALKIQASRLAFSPD